MLKMTYLHSLYNNLMLEFLNKNVTFLAHPFYSKYPPHCYVLGMQQFTPNKRNMLIYQDNFNLKKIDLQFVFYRILMVYQFPCTVKMETQIMSGLLLCSHQSREWVRVTVMVFNATFNYISVISWRSVLLVEETRVPRGNHRFVNGNS